ncbi:MAG: SMP-30/gluconolactonase/LRE family protein [Candidatus Eremiobacteraeota bacterium]|nr:SMP-30/gluconolactonase/LRE family protein [Candidatus Eremiobacteraeota bacterium]
MAILTSGCSKQQSLPLPSERPFTAPHVSTATAEIVVKIPPRPKPLVRANFVSPATRSMTYSIDGSPPLTVALTLANRECKNQSGSIVCTVLFKAPLGTHYFAFSTYDANKVALSVNDLVIEKIQSGVTNVIGVTLGGLVSSFSVVPLAGQPNVAGSQVAGYTMYGDVPASFSVVPLDADGYSMIGAGAPRAVVSPPPAPVALSTPSGTSTTWKFTSSYAATDPSIGLQDSISVSATPVPNSGGTKVKASFALTLYQPWVFAVNAGNSTVSAYDESGGTKAAFSVLSAGNGIAYVPGNKLLYIVSGTGVEAYDSTGISHAAQTFSASTHWGIAYDAHTGYLYVPYISAGGAAAVYDLYGNAIATPYSFGGTDNPQGIAFNAASNEIYIADNANDAVYQYLENGSGGASASCGSSSLGPVGIAYDSHNQRLYVAGNLAHTVIACSSSGRVATSGTFPGLTEPTGIAFDPYTNRLYVTDGNAIKVYDENGNAVSLSGSFSGLNDAQGIVVAP